MLELRVGALLVLGSYLFCGVTAVLAGFHINVYHAFGLKDSAQHIPYAVANSLLAGWVAGAGLFWVQRQLMPSLETRLVLLATLTVILAGIVSRKRLRPILLRVATGGISAEHRLGDILVSDALVSMATILVDIVYSFGLTWAGVPLSDPVNRPVHVGLKTLLVACVPQGIRIRQCIVDYRRSGSRQHLLNLLKYVVANTPHVMRIQMAALDPETPGAAQLRATFVTLIFWALMANALFSYAWDVLVDWRLDRLSHKRENQLRFPIWWYYGAAAADLVLRFTFLFAYDAEHIVFTLQVLELLRRAMWAVFRVESEPIEFTESVEMH